ILKTMTPSNKTQTLPENLVSHGQALNGSPVPFIDKISLTFNPPSKEVAHDLHQSLFQAIDDDELFKDAPGGKGKGWPIAKRVLLPSVFDFKKLPLLQFAYHKSGNLAEKMRLEFVPVDLKPQGMLELHAAMAQLVDNGWASIAKYARVSRVDVSVDLPD